MTAPLHLVEEVGPHPDEIDPFGPVPDPSDFPEPQSYDEVQIDRVLARVRALRHAAFEVDRIADERIAEFERWRAERLAVLQAAIDHRLAFLQAWHEHLLREDAERKTVPLPSGTLKSRVHAEKIDVVDDADFIGWAQVHAPELVREKVVHSPAKSALPGPLRVAQTNGGPVVIDSTSGEPVPGVVWRPASRVFTVETPQPEGGAA